METFNSELEKVNTWMITNIISLNVEKTVSIKFWTRKFDTRELNVNHQTFKFVELNNFQE